MGKHETGALHGAEIGLIGGSSTFTTDPNSWAPADARVIERDLVLETPFGTGPPLAVLELADGRRVLHCRMHGWRDGVTRAAASQQVFWCFREAGVARVLAEGGVGTTREDLAPRDLVIPDDYLDWSMRKDVSLGTLVLLMMRNPVCSEMAGRVASAAEELAPRRRLERGGTYAVTDGRHFESRAEVRALGLLGADVVGQSFCPEVYLAREIGACYAGLYLVANRAEGVGADWQHTEFAEIFREEGELMGRILIAALTRLPADRACDCLQLRKDTLLR